MAPNIPLQAGQQIINDTVYQQIIITDPSTGNPLGSAAAPINVTVVDAVSTNVTRYTGQAKIITTNTPVQLNATSYIMQNGVTITAGPNNAPPVFTSGGTGSTTGGSNVTNVVDGTGNGNLVQQGATQATGSGTNLNTVYVNGTAGDLFFYDAS